MDTISPFGAAMDGDCYYNEFDPFASEWLKNAAENKEIPSGRVDSRSITEVRPDELMGYRQCHFFCGIAGWSLALKLAGYDWLECWSGSCPCFPAGTLVMTNVGMKPIEDIAIGEMVLTHNGRFRPVQHTGSDLAECIEVKGQGHWGIVCTPKHPFLTGRDEWTSAGELNGKRWACPQEIPMTEMPVIACPKTGVVFDKTVNAYRAKGEKDGKPVYLGVFKSRPEAEEARRNAVRTGRVSVRGADNVDQYSLAFAKFLGYWLGDGWVTGDQIVLCGAKTDCELLNDLFREANLPGKAYVERTSSRIRCGSKHLAKWLTNNFGSKADGKGIPTWMYGMPEDFRTAFLDGYATADGHFETPKNGGLVRRFTTVSRKIAVGVRILLNQLGKSASITKTQNNRVCSIEGRVVSERPTYRVTEYGTAKSFRFDGHYGWGRVRSISNAAMQIVYNIAVEEDESYTADGIVVHNCQPFSTAGKQEGSKDERHLWPVFFSLIRECRPPVVWGEQVASSETVGTELEASFVAAIQRGDVAAANRLAIKLEKYYEKRNPGVDLAEIDRRWIDGVRADLETADYTLWFDVLGAHSVNSPHQRQRIFWGAVRNDWLSDAENDRAPENIRAGRSESDIERGGSGLRNSTSDDEQRIRECNTDGRGEIGGSGSRLLDSHNDGRESGRIATEATRYGDSADATGGGLRDAINQGLQGHAGHVPHWHEPGRINSTSGRSIAASDPWSDYTIAEFRDGKKRRVGTNVQPLVDGIPHNKSDWRMAYLRSRLEELGHDPATIARMLKEASRHRTGVLKAAGNAIVPPLAAIFIRSFMESICE